MLTISILSDGKALVKLVPKETLVRAREEKQAAAAAKAANLAAKRAAADELARKKAEEAAKDLELGRSTPAEYFASQKDKYSAFDAEGLPTHDAAGEAINKSTSKRLKKEWDVQVKRHDKFLKAQEQREPSQVNGLS